MSPFRLTLLMITTLPLVQLVAAQQPSSMRNEGGSNAVQRPRDNPAQEASQESKGTIKGRVVSIDGNRPLANALVIARTPGVAGAPPHLATTDEEGAFQLAGLQPNSYLINVSAAGYVAEQSQLPDQVVYYKAGDHVTLRMIKGGVITGRVLNTNGDPVVWARVHAMKVKDANGLPLRDVGTTRDWFTDDRGLYRLYGLEPGSYLVAANSVSFYRDAPGNLRQASSQKAAPTYYPSDSLMSAAPVIVNSGEEASSIDIRYRTDHTYAVRGVVLSRALPSHGAAATPASSMVMLKLTEATTDVTVASLTLMSHGSSTAFNFDGVPDGSYELTTQSGLGTDAASISPLRRLTVGGADLTGVEITLAPLGSVTGHLVLDDTRGREGVGGCQAADASLLAGTMIRVRRYENASLKEPLPTLASQVTAGQPDSRGEFVLRNLNEGRYLFDLRLSGDSLYVRDISLAGATTKTAGDVARNGFLLRSGERVQDLTITLAKGAAKLRGHVFSNVEGASLPARLGVFLVPVERESADDVLRYSEVTVQQDGNFALDHLAPGRYWIIARVAPENKTIAAPGPSGVQDTRTRLQLRREAESANAVIELHPCQQVVDYGLRFASQPAGTN